MEKVPEFQIGSLLRASGMKLVTAESCTGGLVAHRITNVSGSSEYFLGGVVAYDNRVKMEILKVPVELLAQFGAVSEETVLAMAAGVRQLFGADIAVSVSGIAGPLGGSEEKPVGTTWIGLSAPDVNLARMFIWPGDRLENKEASAGAALQLVLDYLNGNPLNG